MAAAPARSIASPRLTTTTARWSACNRLSNNTINGMQVRGGTLTTETVWDDTDIAHIVQDEINVRQSARLWRPAPAKQHQRPAWWSSSPARPPASPPPGRRWTSTIGSAARCRSLASPAIPSCSLRSTTTRRRPASIRAASRCLTQTTTAGDQFPRHAAHFPAGYRPAGRHVQHQRDPIGQQAITLAAAARRRHDQQRHLYRRRPLRRAPTSMATTCRWAFLPQGIILSSGDANMPASNTTALYR